MQRKDVAEEVSHLDMSACVDVVCSLYDSSTRVTLETSSKVAQMSKSKL